MEAATLVLALDCFGEMETRIEGLTREFIEMLELKTTSAKNLITECGKTVNVSPPDEGYQRAVEKLNRSWHDKVDSKIGNSSTCRWALKLTS